MTAHHVRAHHITSHCITRHGTTQGITSHQITWAHITSHRITWHDTTQAIASDQMTWPLHQMTWHASKQVTSPPWNSRRLVHSKEMVWASRWSVALRTFYRQILSLLYSSFFFWNFRPRLARELLVLYIYITCQEIFCLSTSTFFYLLLQFFCLFKNKNFQLKSSTGWWLNQPISKIYYFVKLDHFPYFSGENNPNIWVATT